MSIIDLTGAHAAIPQGAAELLRVCWHEAVDQVDPSAPAPPLGLPALRRALGELVADSPENIVVTGGVRAAVAVLGRRLAHTMVETPTFEDIPALMRSLGHRVERRQWDRFTAVPGVAAWVTHPARNPDGASLPDSTLTDLLDGGWETIVINETYRHHAKPCSGPAPPECFIVGSLSKLVGTGTRIGWIRGVRAAELPTPSLRVSGPPMVAQWAWAAYLSRGGAALLDPVHRGAEEARDAFRAIAGASLVEQNTSEGPSLLALLPEGVYAEEVISSLAAEGVSVGAGHDFGSPDPSLRLCFTGVTKADAEEAGSRFRSALTRRPRRRAS